MPQGKTPLPARRNYEPLDELRPKTVATAAPVVVEKEAAKARKLTLNLEPETDEQLQAFMAEYHLTQTGVINWAIRAAIRAYREGQIEAEFRPAHNRIVTR